MALIKCPECQSEISKSAASCPKCGKPLKKKSSGLGCLLALILSALVVWGIYESEKESPTSSQIEQMQKLKEPGQSLTDTARRLRRMSKRFNMSLEKIVALDMFYHEQGLTLDDLEKDLLLKNIK